MKKITSLVPMEMPEGFEWPEFNDDKQRIRAYTEKYRNMTVSEAFADAYKISVESAEDSAANIIHTALQRGDIISLPIMSVSKNQVIFDTGNYKEYITTNANLWKYRNFPVRSLHTPIRMLVTDVKNGRAVVNPFPVLFNDWINPIIKDIRLQRVLSGETPVKIKNLRLTYDRFTNSPRGYMGDAVVPTISDFVGEEYTIPAFIPGSQIVLNITDDFKQFEGKTVEAFVLNYSQSMTTGGPGSLICSVKELLKFRGERNLLGLFKDWCEDGEKWQEEKKTVYNNCVVTGVINSSKKCGVFVEIPYLNITGMIPMKPDEIVAFKPYDNINIRIEDFEEDKFYDPITKQFRHADPYVIEDDVLVKFNVKPIFALA